MVSLWNINQWQLLMLPLFCVAVPLNGDLQAIQVRIPPEGYFKEEQEGRPCAPESLKWSPLQSPDRFAVHPRSEPGGVRLECGALQGSVRGQKGRDGTFS